MEISTQIILELLSAGVMDNKHVDYRTKQEREQAERGRYGNLLDHAKPNNKICDDILNVDNMCRNLRQQRTDKYEQPNIRRQERIEREKADLQEHKDKHEVFIYDYLNKKEAERKVVEKKKKEEAKRADFYKRVERLVNIDPHMAEVYVQTLNHK